MNLQETRQQIFTAIDKEQANKTRIGVDLLIAEIERLRVKCNGLIDALGESDWASYYPELTKKE